MDTGEALKLQPLSSNYALLAIQSDNKVLFDGQVMQAGEQVLTRKITLIK